MAWQTLRVMIVDDSTHMRHIALTIIRSLGFYSITEAHDGAEALARLRELPADVILVDYRMATLDGLEFVRLLREAPDSPAPNATVVMMTGHGARSTVQSAQKAGVDGFVVMPVSAMSLAKAIERGIAVRAAKPARTDWSPPGTYEV